MYVYSLPKIPDFASMIVTSILHVLVIARIARPLRFLDERRP